MKPKQAFPSQLAAKLSDRASRQTLRSLPQAQPGMLDFSANDYLGLADDAALIERVETVWQTIEKQSLGSRGSRLLGGNSRLAEALEAELADFYGAEAALLFGAGYMANLGLLSSLPGRHDLVIYDEQSHSSLKDGLRLAPCRSASFKHNDLDSLRQRLDQDAEQRWVVVEALYSMDGDLAPLEEIASICAEHQALLMVDEAHSSGIFGPHGSGYCQQLGIADQVFARMHGFGKALGSSGGLVVGSQQLKDYLINFARSFIYSTAPAPFSLLSLQEAHRLLKVDSSSSQALWERCRYFLAQTEAAGLNAYLFPGKGPIFALKAGSVEKAKAWTSRLRGQNIYLKEILSPTVLEGQERLRISLSAKHDNDQIDYLIKQLQACLSNTF